MLTVAYTNNSQRALERLHTALPKARVFHSTLGDIHMGGAEAAPDVLVLDGSVLGSRELFRLAVVKARNPWLLIIGIVAPNAEFLRPAFELGHMGMVDDVLIAGVDDHPERIRAALQRGGLSTVARTIDFACSPLPPLLTRPCMEDVLKRIAQIRRPREFAAALGTSLPCLRQELQASGLFPPKRLLARLRILVAAQMLQHESASVEKIGMRLYASGPAFRNAFRELLGVRPTEVRQHGGLRYAGQLLRVAVQAWRRSVA